MPKRLIDTNVRIDYGKLRHLLVTKRENFLSLLHYFGLLSIRGAQGVMPTLAIPNQTVKRLMYGYLRDAYHDVGVVLGRPVPVRAVAAADGGRGRVAAGAGVSWARRSRGRRASATTSPARR